jgi:hypothetical protein
MNAQERTLSVTAAVLLATAGFSALASPYLCLITATCALALSLYLRHRGAFRNDSTPLLGALLIGGSAIMALPGALIFNVRVAFIVICVVLFPTILFLKIVVLRDILHAIGRFLDRIEAKSRHTGKHPH